MNLAEKGPTEEKELKRCLTQGAWPNPGFNELEKADCYSSLEGKVRAKFKLMLRSKPYRIVKVGLLCLSH